MLGEPEMVQRLPEWEQQLESIDSQELEIHQSQLRLMRDQTSVFVRDLEALRREVVALRPIRSEVQSLEASLRELRDGGALEAARRESSRVRFEQRLGVELEQVLGVQLRALEGDRNRGSPELAAQERPGEPTPGSLLGRVAQLEGETRGVASERVERNRRDLQELRDVVGGEKLARELHKGAVQSSLEALHSSHTQLARRVVELEQQCHSLRDKDLPGLCAQLSKQLQLSGERLEHVEKVQRSATAKHMADLEGLRARQARQEAELAGAASTVRLEALERSVEVELRSLRMGPDMTAIRDRMDYLESMMGASFNKHQRLLEQLREDVKRAFSRLVACDRTCEALAAGESSEKDEMNELRGLLGAAHGQLSSSVELHALELLSLRDADAQQAAGLAGLREELAARCSEELQGPATDARENMSEAQALQLQEAHPAEPASGNAGQAFEGLAQLWAECKLHGARLGELGEVYSILAQENSSNEVLCDRLSDRMEELKVDSTTLEELRQGQDDLSQALELQSEEASDRLGSVQRLVAEAAETSAKAVETAHAGMQKLGGRLLAVEGDRHSMVGLHTQLTDSRATLEARLASLEGRVDSVARRMVQAGAERAREVEAAMGIRLSSLEGRLDCLGRRLAESGRDWPREQGELLEERVDHLEERLQDVDVARESTAVVQDLESRLGFLEDLLVQSKEAHSEAVNGLQALLSAQGAELEAMKEVQMVESSIVAANSKIEQLGSRMRSFEVQNLAVDPAGDESSFESLREQVDIVTSALEESFGRLSGELEVVREHLGSFEDGLRLSRRQHQEDLEAVRSLCEDQAQELEEMKTCGALDVRMQYRLDGCEQALSQFGSSQAETTANIQAMLESIGTRLSSLEPVSIDMEETQDVRESVIRAGDDELVKEREEITTMLQAALEELTERVATWENTQNGHADWGDRLDTLAERVAAVKKVQEGHERALPELQAQVGELETACEATAQELAERVAACEQAQEKVQSGHMDWGDRLDTLAERVAAVKKEQEGHERALPELQAQVGELETACEATVQELAERVAACEQAQEKVQSGHVDWSDRLDTLAERVSTVEEGQEGFERALPELQAQVGGLVTACEAHEVERGERHTQVSDLAGRLQECEGQGKTASTILDRLAGRLGVCEQQGSDWQSQQAAWQEQLESQLFSLQARITGLHQILGSTDESQAPPGASSSSHPKSVDGRLCRLETALEEAGSHQNRLGEKVKALGEQVQELEQNAGQECAVRQAWQESLQQRLEGEKITRDSHAGLVDSRLKFFEESLGRSSERHGGELESVLANHSKLERLLDAAGSRTELLQRELAAERTARLETTTTSQQRLAALERCLAQATDRNVAELQRLAQDVGGRLDPLELRLEDLTALCSDAREALQEETRARKALQEEERSAMEVLQEEQRRAAECLEEERRARNSVQEEERLAREALQQEEERAREAQIKALQEAWEQRLREAQEDGQSAQAAVLQAQLSSGLQDLQARLQQLEQALGDVQQEVKDGHQVHAENLAKMERQFSEGQQVEIVRHRDELNGDLARLQAEVTGHRELHQQLQEKQQQHREALLKQHQEQLEQREELLQHLQESCVRQREELLQELQLNCAGERKERLRAVQALEHRLQELKSNCVSQRVESDAALELERQARLTHERLVQDRLAQDNTQRERSQERLQQLLAQDADLRERRFQGYEEALQHEQATREACDQELREELRQLVLRERSTRDLPLMPAATGDRSAGLGERLQVLQRGLAICDTMLREEIQERCRETKGLWAAVEESRCGEGKDRMDSTVCAIQQDGEEGDPNDLYVPFPCQPLTSFLRLGGQGLPERERRRRIRLFSPEMRQVLE